MPDIEVDDMMRAYADMPEVKAQRDLYRKTVERLHPNDLSMHEHRQITRRALGHGDPPWQQYDLPPGQCLCPSGPTIWGPRGGRYCSVCDHALPDPASRAEAGTRMSRVEAYDCGEHATADLIMDGHTVFFVKEHDEELWLVWGFEIDGVKLEPASSSWDNLQRLPPGDLNMRLTHALQGHWMAERRRARAAAVGLPAPRADGDQ